MTPYQNAKCGTAEFLEKYDCTVVALSIALDIPYWVAHERLRVAGRDNGKPFRFEAWMNAMPTVCGYSVSRWNAYGHTLSHILRNCAKGRFILKKNHHVFAMIDGMVHDHGIGSSTKIYQVWKFVK